MSNFTSVVFTYNEQKRIPYVIRNLKAYSRVCLMDGGSTDKTKEIAERSGASFFSRPASTSVNVETQQNFEFIKSFLNTDWIYWGYADNIAPKSLLEKLTEISKQDQYKMVMIPLYTYLWGHVKNYAQKGYAPFFFHKDFIDFKDNHIHGIGKFLGTKQQLLVLPSKEEYALRHFSTYNVEKFVRGHMRYADTEAQEKFLAGNKFSVWKLFRAMAGYAWIFGRGIYKNGRLGLLITLNYISYRVMAYTRLYELENNITLESIEDSYSKKKEQILKDF